METNGSQVPCDCCFAMYSCGLQISVLPFGLLLHYFRLIILGFQYDEKQKKATAAAVALNKLGYPDSNQERQDQNLQCCQLHHTPNICDHSECPSEYVAKVQTFHKDAKQTLVFFHFVFFFSSVSKLQNCNILIFLKVMERTISPKNIEKGTMENINTVVFRNNICPFEKEFLLLLPQTKGVLVKQYVSILL